jgi:hypothetical protein
MRLITCIGLPIIYVICGICHDLATKSIQYSECLMLTTKLYKKLLIRGDIMECLQQREGHFLLEPEGYHCSGLQSVIRSGSHDGDLFIQSFDMQLEIFNLHEEVI